MSEVAQLAIIKTGIGPGFFWCCGCGCFCCQVASVVSDSVRLHRQQPTRHSHTWDFLGKNTGVGCHFLPQCMKVKSEREVAQSCLTLYYPMDCSLPGSSIHGIFQARVLEWVATAFSVVLWGEREFTQSCLTLHYPMDCSLPGSSIHGIFQARVLEWVAIAFSMVLWGEREKPMMEISTDSQTWCSREVNQVGSKCH